MRPGTLVLAAALAAAAPALGAETKKSSDYWVIGIARFTAEDLPSEMMPLADVIPRLIAADLVVLPPRLQPETEARKAASYSEESALFTVGAELSTRLDERAARFLDPSLSPTARSSEIAAADKKVRESSTNLGKAPEGLSSAPNQILARLWEGNARGELLERPTSSPAATAKGKELDFLVYGEVSMASGYALVRVSGFDASLHETVFSWKGFCAPDDPAPLARDFARRIERWTAGREFARLDIDVDPRSALVSVDGQLLSGNALVAYRFEPSTVSVEATASGYSPASSITQLELGEREELSLKLEPTVSGSASIVADPPDASILVDSIPVGTAPLTVPLSGRREIVSAHAPGREQTLSVLPASGEVSLNLALRLDDGRGPGGRVSEAKDRFYKALGWFFLSVPVSSLATGARSLYAEAATRSSNSGIASASTLSGIAVGVSLTASAALAVNAIIYLTRYLKTAR